MSRLPPLPEPFMELHRELAPAVYQAWANQLRERDRQIVELCALIAENTHPSEPQTIAGCIRLLLEDE